MPHNTTIYEYDYLFKILLIGECQSGKTSILNRFINDTYIEEHENTIFPDFGIKTLNIQDLTFKLQIWDVKNERYGFQKIPYRGAQGIIVVFDVLDPQSFNNAKKWYGEIQRYASENVVVAFVGNKRDVLDIEGEKIRKVSKEEILNYTDICGIDYFEVSSKYNINIDNIFIELSNTMYYIKMKNSTPSNNLTNIKLNNNNNKNKCILN